MVGIPIEGFTCAYGDNQSVISNSSNPESQLKKKSNSIAYHFVREGVARDEWRIAYINALDNPSDLMSKSIPKGEKRNKFVSMLLHHVMPDADIPVDVIVSKLPRVDW